MALIPAMVVMHLVARLVEWYARLMVVLLLREKQRAEFLADALAAPRRRHRGRRRPARDDATHPPTGHRIRLLEEREPLPAGDLDLDLAARAGAELARLEKPFHRGLLEDHRDRLYAR